MIMALIRLCTNMNMLQQLQSYRQSKVQIKTSCCPEAMSTNSPLHPHPKVHGTRSQHPLEHVGQMLLIYMSIRGFCPCFFCCFSLGWVSRTIGKHNSRLWARILYHHLQFLVLLWIAASAYTGLGNAQHSAGNNAQQRTLTLLSPNLTSGNPSVISSLDFLVSIFFLISKATEVSCSSGFAFNSVLLLFFKHKMHHISHGNSACADEWHLRTTINSSDNIYQLKSCLFECEEY